jgi:hypothetical protein
MAKIGWLYSLAADSNWGHVHDPRRNGFERRRRFVRRQGNGCENQHYENQ